MRISTSARKAPLQQWFHILNVSTGLMHDHIDKLYRDRWQPAMANHVCLSQLVAHQWTRLCQLHTNYFNMVFSM